MECQELKKYYNELLNAKREEIKKQGTPYIRRVENPEGVCKTLWIPRYSGNRTASVNLNHVLHGFDENNLLWGANGNCDTPYVIVRIPSDWPDTFENEKLDMLCEIVCKKLGKDENYPKRRVLKADERLPVILETIDEMSRL